MKIVGLTGGIGSGKSTVAQMFRDLGVPVYDSDAEAKELMISSGELKTAISKLLGPKAYIEGELNRAYIASKVFTNLDLLQQLNAIVHPAVKKDFLSWASKQKESYVIQETALIFENNAQDQYDHIILVTAPQEVRLQRVVQRDGANSQEVLDRMKNQMKDDEKAGLAQFQIVNLDLEHTRRQVLELHGKLAAQAD